MAYRNLAPLGTVTGKPQDASGGWLTWTYVALLGVVGFILPLVVPTRFAPVTPSVSPPRSDSDGLLTGLRQNPSEPHPEQTASYASWLLFFFMNPLIRKASKMTHLPYEELPPLADYDAIKHLVGESRPLLDPTQKAKKGQHILWGLFLYYRTSYHALPESRMETEL